MAKEITQVTLDEKDLAEIVAKNYGLDPATCKASIHYSESDGPSPSSKYVVVEGQKLPAPGIAYHTHIPDNIERR